MLFLLFLIILLEVSQNKNFIVLCDVVRGTYDVKVEIEIEILRVCMRKECQRARMTPRKVMAPSRAWLVVASIASKKSKLTSSVHCGTLFNTATLCTGGRTCHKD